MPLVRDVIKVQETGEVKAVYASRADAAASMDRGEHDLAPDGAITQWLEGGVTISVRKSAGATSISDMPDWLPLGDVAPEHFGYTSSASAGDKTAAIDAAITYLGTIGGGTLYFGGTTYETNGSHAVGFGNYHVRMNPGGMISLLTNNTLFEVSPADPFNGDELHDVSFVGIRAVASAATATASTFLDITSTRNINIENCLVDDFRHAFDFHGCTEVWITKCDPRTDNQPNINTGTGGGSWLRLLSLEVASGVDASAEDTDDAGTYYRRCVSFWVGDNQLSHWKDTIDDGVVVQSVDGFHFYGNHILRANGACIKFDPQTVADRLWNVYIYNNHFDGEGPYTDAIFEFPTRPYTSRILGTAGYVAGHAISILGNSMDEGETKCLDVLSDDFKYLIFRGNLIRNSTDSGTLCDLTGGGGLLDFSGNTIITRVGAQPTNAILLGSTVSAGRAWDSAVFDGNTLHGLDGNLPDYWFRIQDDNQKITIKNTTYDPAAGGSGDGLIYDTSTSGTVHGTGWSAGNTPVGLASGASETEGTLTPTVRFATAGDSSFTYARQICDYQRSGKHADIQVRVQFDINAYTTASGNFLIDLSGLPFDFDTSADSKVAMSVIQSNMTLGTATQVNGTVGGTQRLRLELGETGAVSDAADVANFPASTSNVQVIVCGRVKVAV